MRRQRCIQSTEWPLLWLLLLQPSPCCLPLQVHISARSTLLLKGEALLIECLELDGALEISVEDGGSLVVKERQHA